MLPAIVTIARCDSPLLEAVKRGSADSAQLIFNTGPSMRQLATRPAKPRGAAAPSKQVRNHYRPLADGEIAEVPDFVIRPHRFVPALHQAGVHRRD